MFTTMPALNAATLLKHLRHNSIFSVEEEKLFKGELLDDLGVLVLVVGFVRKEFFVDPFVEIKSLFVKGCLPVAIQEFLCLQVEN
jgi:hypothetical protein